MDAPHTIQKSYLYLQESCIDSAVPGAHCVCGKTQGYSPDRGAKMYQEYIRKKVDKLLELPISECSFDFVSKQNSAIREQSGTWCSAEKIFSRGVLYSLVNERYMEAKQELEEREIQSFRKLFSRAA